MSLACLFPRPCIFAVHRVVATLLACLTLAALTLSARADELADAHKLLKNEQQAQALAKVDQYLASKPKDAQARFLKGLILTEMNRSREAITVFTKLTEDYPELPEPYNNLAVIYAQHKQYDKAKQALEMAIRTHPSYATAHENLGDIYARMASQAYDKALQIDSSNASAQTKLAMIRDLISVSGHRSMAAEPTATTPAKSPTVVANAPQAKPAEEKPVRTKPQVADAPKNGPETKIMVADSRADITKSIEAWAEAWSRKNIKAYLGFYANDFHTPGGQSRTAWEAERTKRIVKPAAIQVAVENLHVRTDGANRATASFRQRYRSDSLKVSTNKILVMVKRDGRWLIEQERIGK